MDIAEFKPDWYDVRVISTEIKTIPSGREVLGLNLEVDSGPYKFTKVYWTLIPHLPRFACQLRCFFNEVQIRVYNPESLSLKNLGMFLFDRVASAYVELTPAEHPYTYKLKFRTLDTGEVIK